MLLYLALNGFTKYSPYSNKISLAYAKFSV
jgi:hypothetical protein